MSLSVEEKAILDNLTPREKRELEAAKTLLEGLCRGPVQNFGGMFCNVESGKVTPLRIGNESMYLAVRCLQRLGYGVERTDAGGKPTWVLTKLI